MTGIDQAMEGALADAVRRIRERALRQAMAMTNRLQPGPRVSQQLEADRGDCGAAYAQGHRHARMQIYDEIERMIAREEPPAERQQPGYTSDSEFDGPEDSD